jgi:drug/metabolite transporter (DMT)-like permease
MATTIGLALIAALGFGIADLWNTRIARAMNSAGSIVWKVAVAIAVTLPISLVLGDLPPDRGWAAIGPPAAAGVFYVLGLACLLNGLRKGSLSIVGPLTALDGGVAALLAIVIGERLPTPAYIGLGLAVVGGSMAAAERGQRTAAGVGWALLSACLFAGSFLLLAEADDVAPITAVLVATSVALVLSAPVAAVRGGFAIPTDVRRYVAGAAIVELIASVSGAAALARGPVSVAAVLMAQFATVTLILGTVVLRERPASHQLVGVVLAIVATSLLGATA